MAAEFTAYFRLMRPNDVVTEDGKSSNHQKNARELRDNSHG
ncbi:hypothetical protein [Leisingera sp.]|nr:hypothetical protein [Leisingera sp.]